MIIDGIQLVEGSTLSNATVASGASFPSSPTLGELFYKTGAGVGFYVYDGADWVSAGSGGGGGGLTSPVGIADGGTGQTTASAALTALGGVSLTASNTYTKAQIVTPATLTSASTITINASLSNTFRLVLGTAATLANPTNLVNGQVFNVQIIQDGTGGRTLAYGNKFKFVGGVAPALSTAANAVDILGCYYDGTLDLIFANLNKSYA